MIFKGVQQVSSILLSTTLLMAGVATEPAVAIQGQASPQAATQGVTTSPAQGIAPLTPGALDALVAPIALYPDALVAQVLGAASSPDQIAIAAYWLGQNKNLTGTALSQAVDGQSWDPSIKALTQFPSVLNDLAGNLAWTSNLGQAFENQQADTMAAVQRMRAKAQAAGNLQSTPQIKVVQSTPQTIVIQPADPNVVYVPQYNPTLVYGAPYVVPLYTPPAVIVTPHIGFQAGVALGLGIGVGVGIGGGVGFGGFGWGFHSWGCNWGGGGGSFVSYQHNTYIHNSTYIHNRTTYNNYHPWGPSPHGGGPNGPHPYNGNGFRPNGSGHSPDENHQYAMNNNRNGDHGQIGGNGGTQHLLGNADDRHSNSPGEERRGDSSGSDRFRSHMSGDGRAARAEHDRGRQSMRASHSGGHRGGGGGGHRGGGGRRR